MMKEREKINKQYSLPLLNFRLRDPEFIREIYDKYGQVWFNQN